jgi:formylglycine-generating enzyme
MKPVVPLFTLLLATAAGTRAAPDDLVFIEGGTFKNARSGYHGRNVAVSGFHLGKYEVTQAEWTDVMGSNPSQSKGDRLPVENVSWYECIDYCNRRSLKAGLRPYYTIDRTTKDPGNGNENDDVKWTVTINAGANGYRLPTEAEWEYAAGGGQLAKGYAYSGADEIDKVGWFWQNSGDKPLSGAWNWQALEQNGNQARPVGGKAPNELGLYDMSGNVREWCWDWYAEPSAENPDPRGPSRGSERVWKGGGWIGAEFCAEPSFRAGFEANGRGPDQGFRVCRNK